MTKADADADQRIDQALPQLDQMLDQRRLRRLDLVVAFAQRFLGQRARRRRRFGLVEHAAPAPRQAPLLSAHDPCGRFTPFCHRRARRSAAVVSCDGSALACGLPCGADAWALSAARSASRPRRAPADRIGCRRSRVDGPPRPRRSRLSTVRPASRMEASVSLADVLDVLLELVELALAHRLVELRAELRRLPLMMPMYLPIVRSSTASPSAR